MLPTRTLSAELHRTKRSFTIGRCYYRLPNPLFHLNWKGRRRGAALCCTISARIRLVRSPLGRPGLEVLADDGLVPDAERVCSSGPAVAAAAEGRTSGT